MAKRRLICNGKGCSNTVTGTEGFDVLAKKHGWKQTGGIKTCFICPKCQPRKTFGSKNPVKETELVKKTEENIS